MDGFKREGGKPLQYVAALDDKTNNVTVDDIKKEMFVREMPTEIRRMLLERIETLSFKEAGKIADSYFDAKGRPRHIHQSASNANAVSASFESLSIDDDDVNAVGRGLPQCNRFRTEIMQVPCAIWRWGSHFRARQRRVQQRPINRQA